MIAPNVALEELDSLGLDDETRELFLEGNARRVFGLDRDRRSGNTDRTPTSPRRPRSSTPEDAICACPTPTA